MGKLKSYIIEQSDKNRTMQYANKQVSLEEAKKEFKKLMKEFDKRNRDG